MPRRPTEDERTEDDRDRSQSLARTVLRLALQRMRLLFLRALPGHARLAEQCAQRAVPRAGVRFLLSQNRCARRREASVSRARQRTYCRGSAQLDFESGRWWRDAVTVITTLPIVHHATAAVAAFVMVATSGRRRPALPNRRHRLRPRTFVICRMFRFEAILVNET